MGNGVLLIRYKIHPGVVPSLRIAIARSIRIPVKVSRGSRGSRGR